MKRSAIFFDRDNTLIASDGYLGEASKVQIIEGAAATIARLRKLGYLIVVVSNQSGVGRGLFDESAVHSVNARMDELLQAENPAAIIDRHEFCPFHPQAVIEKYRIDSSLRKPRPGMFFAAAQALDIDLSRSWMIGDAARDVQAAKSAACSAILFRDPKLPLSPDADTGSTFPPDFIVAKLTDAGEIIARHLSAGRPSADPLIARQFIPARIALGENPVNVSPTAVPPKTQRTVSDSSTSALSAGIAPARKTESLPTARPLNAEIPISTALEALNSKSKEMAASNATEATKSQQIKSSPPVTIDYHSNTSTDNPTQTSSKQEQLLEQILGELRKGNDQRVDDFSVSKLLAGILQVIVLAILFLGYVQGRGNVAWLQIYMTVALTFQVMTIALLIMSRQK